MAGGRRVGSQISIEMAVRIWGQLCQQELDLTLRFPHISSCEIRYLVRRDVEEGARMGHASR